MGPKMPVSVVCESPTDISSAIRTSLTNTIPLNGTTDASTDGNIQNQFIATAKRMLLAKIEYQEVLNRSTNQEALKSKYIVLKTASPTATTNNCKVNGNVPNGGIKDKLNASGTTTDQSNSVKKSDELPTPKNVLFSRSQVQIGWKSSSRKWLVGAGMLNMGNTCYLNSTLQAMFHVPAFANWLVSDSAHRETCENRTGIQGGCIICAMAKTCLASQQNSQAIKPYLVYSKLRLVCKHLIPGQQEDAHEFLRYLMEAMEKAFLLRFPNGKQFDQYSKETTPINQILGGYLKSSVRCLSCGHVSVTFQHFEDLLLDIRKANTVEEALDLYFSRERLEDMGYKCESCKKKVSATKQFSLERAPIALCIQLKRFSMAGNKINKHITIKEHLNLSKYSSKKCNNEQLTYRLVAMVTHLGASQHCGHYTAIGLTDAGGYYQFDDSCVRPISLQNVLGTNAYNIIFYELDTSQINLTINKPQNLNEISKNPQEQRNGMCPITKIYPSTQTSLLKTIECKRKNDLYKINGTDSLTDNYNKIMPISSISNNGSDHNPSKSISNISPYFNLKRRNENLITIKINMTPNESNDDGNGYSNSSTKSLSNGVSNGYHAQATLPSLPTLDDTDDDKFEANINAAFNRPNIDCNQININNRLGANTPTLKSNTVLTSPTIQSPEKVCKSLVPYTSDDDDDEDDHNADNVCVNGSVKTSRSGPFQVTATTPKNTTDVTTSSPTVQITSANTVAFKRYDICDNSNRDNSTKITDDVSMEPVNTKNSPIVAKRPHTDADVTAKKLMKLNHRGYGTNVLSWNGSKSSIEQEVLEDKKEEQTRQVLDANDADMDRGQQKKIKTIITTGRPNPGYNPFTEAQMTRNNWSLSGGNNGSNGKGRPYYQVYRQKPNRYHNGHRNFGKRYFQNNKKGFINRRHPNK